MRKPCTNCGQCCMSGPCPIAAEAGIESGPCPFLVEGDGKFFCGVYAALPDGSEKRAVKIILGVGRGCTNEELNGLGSVAPIPLPA